MQKIPNLFMRDDHYEMTSEVNPACQWVIDGDIQKSLNINAERFGISSDLLSILTNTVREMGWIKPA